MTVAARVSGNSGSMTIHAQGDVRLSGRLQTGGRSLGSGIRASTEGEGLGGDIILTAANLWLDDAAQISAESTGTAVMGIVEAGNAGNISVEVGRSVVVRDDAAITTRSAQSSGGNIAVKAARSVELDRGRLDAEARIDGGDILVDSVLVHLRQGSLISASAVEGDGGNVDIQTLIFNQSQDSRVFASSRFELSGLVGIAGDLVSVPASLLHAQAQIHPSCASRFVNDRSSFTLRGTGGTPLCVDGWVVPFHLARRDHTDPPIKPAATRPPAAHVAQVNTTDPTSSR